MKGFDKMTRQIKFGYELEFLAKPINTNTSGMRTIFEQKDETKKRYNALFSLDDSIEGYENILKNFDKKYFNEAALKETIHQEKITPIVMKKKL